MHGIIHLELKKYIEARHGPAAWAEVLEMAGLEPKFSYVRVGQYPDQELTAIVEALGRRAGAAPSQVLEDFGKFMAPDLLAIYPNLVRPEWRTLDLLLNTERTIHEIVRHRHPGAHPPLLRCVRAAPAEVVITYTSRRKLCAVARGIVAGIAQHYGERVEIVETACMLRGAAACTLVVRVAR